MKVKINNIDEFCEALKAGYLLRSEDVDIQLKENMFYFLAEGLGNVSDPVHIFQYEKPDPLKIEVGKWYETSGHQKARCFIVEKERCHFTIDNNCHFFTNKNGVYIEHQTSRYNIIGPWKED